MTSRQHADNAKLDVIMVTYDNPMYVAGAMKSILATWAWYPFRLIVVNNGAPQNVPPVAADSQAQVVVLNQKANLGWEGGLKAGLDYSDAPFVLFANDDIVVPQSSRYWARNLLWPMRNPKIGAIGPTSNFVSGLQNISLQPTYQYFPVTYLIGFFMMVRRSALDEVGGVDCGLPGGDDIDLSIRLRKAGYILMVRNDCFIFHHGQITGQAVHGDKWNSVDMMERTSNALIAKHGLKEWFHTAGSQGEPLTQSLDNITKTETEVCASWTPEYVAQYPARVLDMGCGERLTVPWAVGVDQFPEGDFTPWRHLSKAQIVADIFRPLPMFENESVDVIVARHVLEHTIDIITVLREWTRILKVGGRLIVASPNEEIVDGVPMDVTHLHGLTPDSVRSMAEVSGLKQIAYTPDCGNRLSFVSVFEKL